MSISAVSAASAFNAGGGVEKLNIVIVGHVDHGKSTLLGRLYADTGALPDGKLEKVQAICRQQGKEFEYAFLFDAFLEEQEQGVTIDTARTFFTWGGREYIIIDAPGHKEFLKNMVSGAARAEAALLVIDAAEGIQEQSKRHGYLLSMLGVPQVTVVVNKMDLVSFREQAFRDIEAGYRSFLGGLGVHPEYVVPASARLGENITQPSPRMAWHHGPSVLDALGHFRKEAPREEAPLRLPIQDVYKFDARRILAGRLSSGRLRAGDRLLFSPSGKTAVVKTIEAFAEEPPPDRAVAGRSIGVTLDEQIFVERGEVACHEHAPPLVSSGFRCHLFWMGNQPLTTDREYLLRLATYEVRCRVEAIHRILDSGDLGSREGDGEVHKNEVAELTVQTRTPLPYDLYADLPVTGRFVLVDGYDVSGGGIITQSVPEPEAGLRDEARRRDLSWVKGQVGQEERALAYGHRSALVLFGGEHHAYQRSLAQHLEAVLLADGRRVYLMDPDNLRYGLDADLEPNVILSPSASLRVSTAQNPSTGSRRRLEGGKGSNEALRRFGEVARILLDAGLIVLAPTPPLPDAEQAIEVLLHPAPILAVRVGPGPEQLPLTEDLSLSPETPVAEAATRVIESLSGKHIFTREAGDEGRARYPRYTI